VEGADRAALPSAAHRAQPQPAAKHAAATSPVSSGSKAAVAVGGGWQAQSRFRPNSGLRTAQRQVAPAAGRWWFAECRKRSLRHASWRPVGCLLAPSQARCRPLAAPRRHDGCVRKRKPACWRRERQWHPLGCAWIGTCAASPGICVPNATHFYGPDALARWSNSVSGSIVAAERRSSAVFDAVWNCRKPMDWVVWPGANHSDALLHRTDLQRRQSTQDAVLCST